MQTPPILITENAAKEIHRILQTKKIPDNYYLRVGIKGSGCSAAYMIGFDTMQPNDTLINSQGIELIYDRRQLMYLLDVELDFVELSDEQGFVFRKGALSLK
jgi:iron-sulfur cluster assembly protein